MATPAEHAPMLAGFDLLASAVVVLDEDGNTVFLNQAAEQLFEVSQRIAVGHPFARLFVDGVAVGEVELWRGGVEAAGGGPFGVEIKKLDGAAFIHAERPLHDIEMVRTEVGDVTAAVIVEPAPV